MAAIMSAVGPYGGQTADASGGPSPDDLLAQLNALPTSPGEDVGLTLPASVGPVGVTVGQAQQQVQQQAAQDAQRQGVLRSVQAQGAPLWTRTVVGAHDDDASRLATLRQLQQNAGITPDAQPVPGTGNFVYTEPSTGKRTLYRAGFGMGDVASLAPEAVGMALGGAAGGAAAAPSAALLGPAGPVTGFALGAEAGKEATQKFIEYLSGTSAGDVRSLPQSLLDTATGVGVNAVLPEIGRTVLSPFEAAPSLVDPQGRVPSMLPGDLLGKPPWQVFEKGLWQTPGGSAPMSAASRQAAVETGALRAQTASDLTNASRVAAGQPPTLPTAGPERLGSLVQNAATRAAQAYDTRVGQLTDNVENAVGTNTPTSLDPLRTLQANLQAQLARTPSETAAIQPAIDRVTGIIDSAGQGGTLPWGGLRTIRANVNREISTTGPGQMPGTDTQYYNQIPGALSDAMDNQAQQAGPAAAEAWRRYNAVISNYRQAGGAGDALTALAKPETSSDTIASRFLQGSKGDAQQLAYLRGMASPQDWDQIAGSFYNRLGLPNPGSNPTGQSFSPATFLTNWNALSDAGKNTLFGGTRFDAIRDDMDGIGGLVNLSRAQQASISQFGNPPGTARAVGSLAVLQAVGKGLVGLATGEGADVQQAIQTGAGLVGLPYAGAKLMTSQPFLRWVRTAASQPAGSWTDNIAKLGTVGAADPAIQNEIAALQRNLPQQPPQ